MKHECFDFKAKIFQVEGGYFFSSRPAGDVYFRVNLANGVDASLRLDSIRREFGIADDTDDGALLAKVSTALRYVKQIAPGDRIPSEILDGTASWAVEDRHIQRAENRLRVKMLEWLSPDLEQLRADGDVDSLFEDPETQASLQKAFGDAAEKLGFGKGQGDRVIALIERLANEFSYIEALREFYSKVFRIQAGLPVVAYVLGSDKIAAQEIGRVKHLIRRPLARYTQLFENVDAQTGEVLSALKNITLTTEFIRATRDELHEQSLLWSEVVDDWIEDPSDARKREYQKLGRLYRFLAQNFLDEWQ